MDIETFTVQQLQIVKEQLDEELGKLTTSFTQLRHAYSKYRISRSALDGLESNRPILVPLTSALFVPGLIIEPTKVLVEIGTGYYLEKDIIQARSFCDRKVLMLRENMDKIANLINQRKQTLDVVSNTIQRKTAS